MSVSVVDTEVLRVLQRASRGKTSSFGLGRCIIKIGNGAVSAVSIVSADNMLEAMYQWSAVLDQDQTTSVQALFKTETRPDISKFVPEEEQRSMERQAAINVIISSAIDLRKESVEASESGYPMPDDSFRIVPPMTFDDLVSAFREENRRIGKALVNLGVENYDLFENGKIVLTLVGNQMLSTDEEILIESDTDFAVLDVAEENGVGEPAYVKAMLSRRPWMSRSGFVESVKRFADEGYIEFFSSTGERYPKMSLHQGPDVVPDADGATIVPDVDIEAPEARVAPSTDTETDADSDEWWESVSGDLAKLQFYVADLRRREHTTDSALNDVSEQLEDVDTLIASTKRQLEDYDQLVRSLEEATQKRAVLIEKKKALDEESAKVGEEKASLMRRMRP